MEIGEALKSAAQYGLPTVLLLGFLYSMKRGISAFATWAAPIAAQLSDRFIKHLDAIETVGNGLLAQQKSQTEILKQHQDILHGHTQALDAIKKAVVK